MTPALALSAWVVIIFALVVVHHLVRCRHDAWTLEGPEWSCDACGERVPMEVIRND